MDNSKMVKIVYNRCYGGFFLSDVALRLYVKFAGIDYPEDVHKFLKNLKRHDPILVKVVEALDVGSAVGASLLRITEVPEGTKYFIEEYDGFETIQTIDSIEWITATLDGR